MSGFDRSQLDGYGGLFTLAKPSDFKRRRRRRIREIVAMLIVVQLASSIIQVVHSRPLPSIHLSYPAPSSSSWFYSSSSPSTSSSSSSSPSLGRRHPTPAANLDSGEITTDTWIHRAAGGQFVSHMSNALTMNQPIARSRLRREPRRLADDGSRGENVRDHHSSMADSNNRNSTSGLMPTNSRQQQEAAFQQKLEELKQKYMTNRAINDSTYYILLLVYSSLILFGTISNTLICLTAILKPQILSPRNIFIVNLACSDLLLCVFTMPFSFIEISMKMWQMGLIPCKLVAGLQATSIFVSTISITAIALDRYKVIVYPTHQEIGGRTAIIILGSVWLGALLLSSPLFCFRTVEHLVLPHKYDKIDSIDFCVEDWPFKHGRGIYSVISMIFQYVLPITIVCLVYLKISRKLKKRLIRRQRLTQLECQQKRQLNLIKRTHTMLVSVALVFILSWLPLNLLNLIGDFSDVFKGDDQQFRLVFAVCHLIGCSSACSNPILYGYLNENFRKELRQVYSFHLSNLYSILRRYLCRMCFLCCRCCCCLAKASWQVDESGTYAQQTPSSSLQSSSSEYESSSSASSSSSPSSSSTSSAEPGSKSLSAMDQQQSGNSSGNQSGNEQHISEAGKQSADLGQAASCHGMSRSMRFCLCIANGAGSSSTETLGAQQPQESRKFSKCSANTITPSLSTTAQQRQLANSCNRFVGSSKLSGRRVWLRFWSAATGEAGRRTQTTQLKDQQSDGANKEGRSISRRSHSDQREHRADRQLDAAGVEQSTGAGELKKDSEQVDKHDKNKRGAKREKSKKKSKQKTGSGRHCDNCREAAARAKQAASPGKRYPAKVGHRSSSQVSGSFKRDNSKSTYKNKNEPAQVVELSLAQSETHRRLDERPDEKLGTRSERLEMDLVLVGSDKRRQPVQIAGALYLSVAGRHCRWSACSKKKKSRSDSEAADDPDAYGQAREISTSVLVLDSASLAASEPQKTSKEKLHPIEADQFEPASSGAPIVDSVNSCQIEEVPKSGPREASSTNTTSRDEIPGGGQATAIDSGQTSSASLAGHLVRVVVDRDRLLADVEKETADQPMPLCPDASGSRSTATAAQPEGPISGSATPSVVTMSSGSSASVSGSISISISHSNSNSVSSSVCLSTRSHWQSSCTCSIMSNSGGGGGGSGSSRSSCASQLVLQLPNPLAPTLVAPSADSAALPVPQPRSMSLTNSACHSSGSAKDCRAHADELHLPLEHKQEAINSCDSSLPPKANALNQSDDSSCSSSLRSWASL